MTRYVVQMHGEPGSGKSTLARAIGRQLTAIALDKDIISSALIGGGQAKGSTGPGSYLAIYGLARSIIEQGYSVVIDSPCYWPLIEQNGRGIASATHARYAMVECTNDVATISHRLATRERLESNPSERASGPLPPGAYQPACERLILETNEPADALAERAVAFIRRAETS